MPNQALVQEIVASLKSIASNVPGVHKVVLRIDHDGEISVAAYTVHFNTIFRACGKDLDGVMSEAAALALKSSSEERARTIARMASIVLAGPPDLEIALVREGFSRADIDQFLEKAKVEALILAQRLLQKNGMGML